MTINEESFTKALEAWQRKAMEGIQRGHILNAEEEGRIIIEAYEAAKNMGDAGCIDPRTPATDIDSDQEKYNKAVAEYYEEKKRRDNNAKALVQKLVKAFEHYREEGWLGGEDGVAAQALTEAEAYLKQEYYKRGWKEAQVHYNNQQPLAEQEARGE